ncbi:unnamed protein product [Alternaria burnsii]|nr:unnamed protein product [Alternaria burnsii]
MAINQPILPVPQSDATVAIRVIDTGSRASTSASEFFKPTISGHDILANSPAYPFLIGHGSGRKAIFDFGIRKDWRNFLSALIKMFEPAGV